MSLDLSKPTTQAKFAALVGVTQPVVSGLLARGVLTKGDAAGNWLLAYCGQLRDSAAGRERTVGQWDLDTERARLASAQADKIEMENAVRRGELAPVAILESVLTRAGSIISATLEAIPATLKRRFPSLTADDVTVIRKELASARNAMAALSLEEIEEADDDEEDE